MAATVGNDADARFQSTGFQSGSVMVGNEHIAVLHFVHFILDAGDEFSVTGAGNNSCGQYCDLPPAPCPVSF